MVNGQRPAAITTGGRRRYIGPSRWHREQLRVLVVPVDPVAASGAALARVCPMRRQDMVRDYGKAWLCGLSPLAGPSPMTTGNRAWTTA